jgi:WD40 repeat protein
LLKIEDTHELNVSAVASIKQGDKVYTGSRDYHVKGWDVETGKNICDFHTPRNIVTAMKAGVDSTDKSRGIAGASSLLFQASEDLSIKVWDVRESSKTPAIRIGGFVYFALSLDTSDDGHLLAAGCKGFNGVGCDVKVWDLRNLNEPLGECSEHQQDVTSVRFLTNNRFTSCSKDGTVRLWDAKDRGAPKNVATHNTGFKYTSLCRITESGGSNTSFAAGSFEGHLELLSCNSAGTATETMTCEQIIMGPSEDGEE